VSTLAPHVDGPQRRSEEHDDRRETADHHPHLHWCHLASTPGSADTRRLVSWFMG
jgi:hypothetical protein